MRIQVETREGSRGPLRLGPDVNYSKKVTTKFDTLNLTDRPFLFTNPHTGPLELRPMSEHILWINRPGAHPHTPTPLELRPGNDTNSVVFYDRRNWTHVSLTLLEDAPDLSGGDKLPSGVRIPPTPPHFDVNVALPIPK